jgi:hypothetical protein
MFAHGSCFYLKSVIESSHRAEVVKSVFKRLSEFNAAPGNEIQHFCMFDYLSHRRVLSVPANATAHIRSPGSLVGCALKWPGSSNTPGIEQAAKLAAQEITNIITAADPQVSDSSKAGYGNFSKYRYPIPLIHSRVN